MLSLKLVLWDRMSIDGSIIVVILMGIFVLVGVVMIVWMLGLN